ncbi:MAG: PEP-CTERM sorting domain-containing protein [bacterium]|nr:PEP-CTERM sorting domain-containing protein [bacterium]
MKRKRTVLLIGLVLFTRMLAGCSSDSGDSQNEVVLAYTFETGTEGWVAGFADLPADASPEFYELESSHQQLPSGLPGYGIYIQGNNHSDDLFMYLKTQVGGLQPNSTYRVDFSIDLATNVPEGMVGIGGAPGEAVYVKAGAVASEPLAVADNTGWLRMNIDKGNQSQGGADMIVIGDIAHPQLSPNSTDEYKIKSLDSAGQVFQAVTDGNGSLWCIVGTDSGFEGLTTLYYSQIVVTFTDISGNMNYLL